MIDSLFFVDFAAVGINDFIYPTLGTMNNHSDCNVDFDADFDFDFSDAGYL